MRAYDTKSSPRQQRSTADSQTSILLLPQKGRFPHPGRSTASPCRRISMAHCRMGWCEIRIQGFIRHRMGNVSRASGIGLADDRRSRSWCCVGDSACTFDEHSGNVADPRWDSAFALSESMGGAPTAGASLHDRSSTLECLPAQTFPFLCHLYPMAPHSFREKIQTSKTARPMNTT